MLNNLSIIGYLVRDPNLSLSPTNKSVCKFVIANMRPKTATKEREVDFIDCIAGNKTAEFIKKWFKKGDPIVVVGRLQSQVLVGSDGRSNKVYEVNVITVDFVPPSKVESQSYQ